MVIEELIEILSDDPSVANIIEYYGSKKEAMVSLKRAKEEISDVNEYGVNRLADLLEKDYPENDFDIIPCYLSCLKFLKKKLEEF